MSAPEEDEDFDLDALTGLDEATRKRLAAVGVQRVRVPKASTDGSVKVAFRAWEKVRIRTGETGEHEVVSADDVRKHVAAVVLTAEEGNLTPVDGVLSISNAAVNDPRYRDPRFVDERRRQTQRNLKRPPAPVVDPRMRSPSATGTQAPGVELPAKSASVAPLAKRRAALGFIAILGIVTLALLAARCAKDPNIAATPSPPKASGEASSPSGPPSVTLAPSALVVVPQHVDEPPIAPTALSSAKPKATHNPSPGPTSPPAPPPQATPPVILPPTATVAAPRPSGSTWF